MRTFLRTDLGNGERLVHDHGRDLHFVPSWGKWLIFDGERWAKDETREIERRAKSTIRRIWDDVKELDDKVEKRELTAWALQSESNGKLRAMIERAAAEPGVAISPDALDSDPWLLNVANGTIDLRTGKLEHHNRKDLCTHRVPVKYDPEARCDRWERFISRAMDGNEAKIRFLQRAVGYSLTADTGERCLFFLHGEGANGKTTFLEVLRALTGDYSAQADFTTFLERKGDGPRNDIARLFGARVVTSSEVGEGKRLNESLVKTLTGNDVVAARFLFAETFEFRPQFKMWLAANHKPVIRGQDPAIWQRVKLVPFTVSIPESERDPNLYASLMAELPGILAWAVAGCLMWQKEKLNAPEEVTLATEKYRRESDTLGSFIEDCCDTGPAELYATPATELYQAFRRWAEEGGEYAWSQTAFGRRLEDRGITAEKRGSGANKLTWRVGVSLTRSPLTNDRGLFGRGNSNGSRNGTKDHAKEAAADKEEALI